jgi:hypothetical protein
MEGGSAESNGGMREGAPKIPGFLSRGNFVSISARIGNDLAGYVCDPGGDLHGYEFLPWSSIERISAEA